MTPKKNSKKAVWAVSIAVLVVAVGMIGLFLLQMPSQQQETIVLPPATVVEPTVEPTPEQKPESDFLDVTNENVLPVLQTLTRPVAYHQIYSVTVGADDVQTAKTVELWVNGSMLHAEVSDERQTRVLISNGSKAYLWYKDEKRIITVPLRENLTEEDLLGLPAFDAFLALDQSDVVDSDYLVLDDPQMQCIYVSTQDSDGVTTRHWVSLESGLLYQSDVLKNSNQVYTIRQSDYSLLATEDESFDDRFVLPDGSDPFIEAETPQP